MIFEGLPPTSYFITKLLDEALDEGPVPLLHIKVALD